MKPRTITITAATACFLLLAPSLLLHGASAQDEIDPLALVPKLLQELDSDGFTVQRGTVGQIDPVQRLCQGAAPTAVYNNPGAPYFGLTLPRASEETAPLPAFVYRLREDEAVLLVGKTPPPMAYFSYQTFVQSRWNINRANYDLLFSYLGDTVNSMTIQTTGPDPYDRPMALIMTGHGKTQERLRAALLAAGYPAAVINTETLTPSLVRFGYGSTADQLIFLQRMAIPARGSEQAVLDYLEKPPLAVFRVRPKVASALDPLPAPMLRTRGTGRTEMDLYPTLQKLRQAILEMHGSGYQASELDTGHWLDEGYPAFQRNLRWNPPVEDGALGLSRDANYLATEWFDLPEDGFAMIYGVNHAATGKATYSSAAVYLGTTPQAGISAASSSEFPGTAAPYMPGDPSADQFYVWKVARDCNNQPNCMEARAPCAAVSPGAKVRIGFRAYVEPSTKVGPYDVELLYDRVILFTH
jgi:hypothetical protein